MRTTVTDIARMIPTEAAAYEYMESLCWPDGVICQHCGCNDATYIAPAKGVSRKTRSGAMSERRVWRCCHCRKQFSVLTGSVFHGTKIPLRKWILVFFEMVSSKNGLAAREIERKYGMCPRSAWFMLHRIRAAMANGGLAAKMANTTIAADETYVGGLEKNKHADKRTPGVAGRHHGPKTPVFTLIDANTGESRSAVVPNVSGDTLRAAILANVDPNGSALGTDKWGGYLSIGREFSKHVRVDHDKGQYVIDGMGTNLAENFFSQLKRSIDGTHHHVSAEHLPRYLAEFDFRYSTCKESDTERFARLMGQVGGRRLTYKRITEWVVSQTAPAHISP
jgi:transposase-like protein